MIKWTSLGWEEIETTISEELHSAPRFSEEFELMGRQLLSSDLGSEVDLTLLRLSIGHPVPSTKIYSKREGALILCCTLGLTTLVLCKQGSSL